MWCFTETQDKICKNNYLFLIYFENIENFDAECNTVQNVKAKGLTGVSSEHIIILNYINIL